MLNFLFVGVQAAEVSKETDDVNSVIEPMGLFSNETGYAYSSTGNYIGKQENWTVAGCVSYIKSVGYKGYVLDTEAAKPIVSVVLADIDGIDPRDSNRSISTPGSDDTIRGIQKALIALGYSCGSAGPDGYFGSGTKSAVQNFQSRNGLSSDGIVGYNTYYKLATATK